MKGKRYLLALILLAIVIGLGYAYWFNYYKTKISKVPQPQDTLAKVKTVVNVYGLKGVSTVGMIKMFEDKASIGNDYDVKYQVADSPDILMSKLTTKAVDLAALPTNLAATIYNKGMDYKLAAVTSWGVLYVVNSDNTVKTINDLKGKTINISDKGSTPDVVLRYLLSKNGLNPEKDVKLDYTLGHVEIAQAMIADRVKIGILPEPFVTMVLAQNKKVSTLMDVQKEWQNQQGANVPFAQTCLVVRGDFAKNNAQAVAKLLDLNKDSITWVNANPSLAGPLVEKNNLGIKANIAQLSIPKCNFRYEDATNTKNAVNTFLKVIFDFSPKDVGGKMPDEGFFYKR